ncbi:hypothetical protein F5890DRAFT_1522623 [Lentinula detonsa]|uniref:Uncharacterized protein n=1 Tax=Lentinula detonsa TaxID=2804962 RepID=A0AA38PXE6_9AGAR|nr:hypothetical protein F5890DRAFT_1522623 [Lentinula detonsa]
MVARKSKKRTSKPLNYRERAVSAIHALQKSHRKGGAHLTSIKSQVRKDAERRKEKLGPQWATWVTKAVHQLTESGLLLKNENSSTHYEFSPASKRILKDRERELPVAGSHGEEILIKHLFRATAGTKRPAESGIDSTPTKKSRATRASTQMTQGSPWLKKKKIELIAEIERLQRARLQSPQISSRSPSPLTDLDEDENARMLDTDEHFFSSPGNPEMHPGTSDLPTRPSTPVEFDQSFYPSTPVRPHESLTRKRPLLQVTRTQSGSYLANGRPTPEPPEPADRDIHNGPSVEMVTGVDCPSPSMNRPTGLATPGRTPARTSSYKSIASGQTIPNELARICEENTQLRVAEAAHASNITNLDAELQSLRKTNADNEERAATLAIEISTLQAALAQSTQRCSSLDVQLSADIAEISSLQASLDTKNQEIADFIQRLQDAGLRLEDRTQDLDTAHSVATKLKEDLMAIRTQMENREVELTSKVEVAERSIATSSAALEQKVTELEGIQKDLQDAQETIKGYQEMLEALKLTHAAEVDELNTTINSSYASLSSSESALVKLRSEMDQSTETCAHLRGELEQANLDKTRLNQELANERLYSVSVKGELDHALLRICEAEKEIEEMETLRTDDAATITKLRTTIERIRAIQMEQWAGITEEVTQASPAPKRPRFSI